jgi:hypothetical protein
MAYTIYNYIRTYNYTIRTQYMTKIYIRDTIQTNEDVRTRVCTFLGQPCILTHNDDSSDNQAK